MIFFLLKFLVCHTKIYGLLCFYIVPMCVFPFLSFGRRHFLVFITLCTVVVFFGCANRANMLSFPPLSIFITLFSHSLPLSTSNLSLQTLLFSCWKFIRLKTLQSLGTNTQPVINLISRRKWPSEKALSFDRLGSYIRFAFFRPALFCSCFQLVLAFAEVMITHLSQR